MPWIQFGFWCADAFFIFVVSLILCMEDIRVWGDEASRMCNAWTLPALFFGIGALTTIINIIMSYLMIRIVVRDRSNLSEIFEPFDRYTGCYDAPYAYLDEDDLTTWPGVSRRMMFYFFFSLIVQPFLIFCYTITYR